MLKWKCAHADWFWERGVNTRVPIPSLKEFPLLILSDASRLEMRYTINKGMLG